MLSAAADMHAPVAEQEFQRPQAVLHRHPIVFDREGEVEDFGGQGAEGALVGKERKYGIGHFGPQDQPAPAPIPEEQQEQDENPEKRLEQQFHRRVVDVHDERDPAAMLPEFGAQFAVIEDLSVEDQVDLAVRAGKGRMSRLTGVLGKPRAGTGQQGSMPATAILMESPPERLALCRAHLRRSVSRWTAPPTPTSSTAAPGTPRSNCSPHPQAGWMCPARPARSAPSLKAAATSSSEPADCCCNSKSPSDTYLT